MVPQYIIAVFKFATKDQWYKTFTMLSYYHSVVIKVVILFYNREW